MAWWNLTKDIAEALNNIAGVVLVIGIWFGLRQLKASNEQLALMKKDLNDRNLRAAAEKSLEFLAYFEKEILPSLDQYRRALNAEVQKLAPTDKFFNDDFTLDVEKLAMEKEVMADAIVKQRVGLIKVLNQFEFFSAAVESRLADEDFLFTPLSNVFCDFVKEEHITISLYKSEGIAPYKHIVSLHKKWSNRKEIDKLQLQKLEAEHKIREHGDAYTKQTPIGF